jgi:bla regulator protein blaR1
MLIRKEDCGKLLRLAIVAAGFASVLPIRAQISRATGLPPSFEAATVKPMQAPPPPREGGPPPLAQDEVLMYVNTRLLIASAYNVQAFARSEITGGPDWIDNQVFEVHGRIEHSVSDAMQKMPGKQRQQQIELMEQSLLSDRFKLQVHFETRELPEFALAVAKSGPKLVPSEPSAPHGRPLQTPKGQGWEVKASGASIRSLVDMLQMQPEIGGRLIVDRTGLTGPYEITLDWQRERGGTTATDENGSPSLLTALQEQLGLRLVETKGPVEVIVIDHIERPSGN